MAANNITTTMDLFNMLNLSVSTTSILSEITEPGNRLADIPTPFLAVVVRDVYRAVFHARVAAGEARPFVLPYSVFGTFVLPVLYMTIPHRNRPWLYAARWLVLAFIVVFNVHILMRSSSTTLSISYISGFSACWGILFNFIMLAWTAPQFDYERVARRKKKIKPSPRSSSGKPSQSDSHSSHSTLQNGEPTAAGLRKRADSKKRWDSQDTALDVNLHEDEYEYYWQAFPENGPLTERLGWVFDLYTNLRGVGWSWAVPSVPSPAPPERPRTEELVKMDTIPLETFVGCRTYTDESDFLRRKITSLSISYIAVDFIKLAMMEDPYFVLGNTSLSLPPHLAAFPPWLLSAYRNTTVLITLYAALVMLWSSNDLAQYFLFRKWYAFRGEPWQYSTMFGSFSHVFDRGLAGFWGAWWHQTFRYAFSAPGTWLVKHGYLKKGAQSTKMVYMFTAFLLSGALHGCASITSMPETNWLKPCYFFWASGVGVVLQSAFCTALKPHISKLPRTVRRLGNFAFVLVWLLSTAWSFSDDFSATGLWLLDPVPVSLSRALGFGRGETSWWKPDPESQMRWYTGQHWWESGISL